MNRRQLFRGGGGRLKWELHPESAPAISHPDSHGLLSVGPASGNRRPRKLVPAGDYSDRRKSRKDSFRDVAGRHGVYDSRPGLPALPVNARALAIAMLALMVAGIVIMFARLS